MSIEWQRFGEITEHVFPGRRLFRSSAPNYAGRDETQMLTPTAVAFLKEKGINCVLSFNARSYAADEIAMLDKAGIKYRHFLVPDFHPPTIEQLNDAIEFALSIPDGSILVHCGTYDNRSLLSLRRLFNKVLLCVNPTASTMDEVMESNVKLDLLIILDVTASMDSYIESAKNNIIEICSMLRASGRLKKGDGLRVSLLAYRDYPAGDKYSVLIPHPFTEDLKVMKGYLTPLKAEGGHDYPEAFGTALEYAYDEIDDWRDDALKVIIVVTDAAPHGINEKGDSFPDGGPPGMNVRDPLELAKVMAEMDFSIFVLACEPTLGKTTEYAIDFYKAITTLTLGTLCSLTDSKLIASVIIGLVLERLDLKRLSLRYREEIWRRIFEDGQSLDDVVGEVHRMLASQDIQVTTMQTGNMYNDIPAALENYKTFLSSESLAEAKKSLKKVPGTRVSFASMKAIKEYERIQSRGRTFTVSVYFKNTGSNIMELRLFDAESGDMKGQLIVPNGHVMIRRFSINIPINFALVCGRFTKNFSRTFSKDIDIDVEHIFSQS
ncbi:hypothetical protein ACEPAH_4203 [Sanghuangporus vaninii]